jgi:FMN-dependent NADH-azoreductase
MCKVLYIRADSSNEEQPSRACAVSDDFVKEYRKMHPKDEITTLDLNKEGIKTLSNNDMLFAISHQKTKDTGDPVLRYAYQFAEADKYIIAQPLCDAGVSAVLNYMDHVGIMDIAFKYTPYGSVGLLKGKKAVSIVSRGADGQVQASPLRKLGEDYLKTVFSFFGITDFKTIQTDGRGKGPGLNKAIRDAEETVRAF